MDLCLVIMCFVGNKKNRSTSTCINHCNLPQQEVIRSLVKRYVAAMIRSAKTDEGLTEENFKVSLEKNLLHTKKTFQHNK